MSQTLVMHRQDGRGPEEFRPACTISMDLLVYTRKIVIYYI